MKPLKLRLIAASQTLSAPLHVIEKDYILSYVLESISQQPQLAQTLVFKGGTALKKMYFGDYRFSEDLDFSTRNAPQAKQLKDLLTTITEATQQRLSHYGPFHLAIKPKSENTSHPFGQEAFIINIQFPWHQAPQCRIKLEFTHDEPVLLQPHLKTVIHGYDEMIKADLFCYPIEEIIAEKLRALLQTHQNLTHRGWNRPRARDYYDLWRILGTYATTINLPLLSSILMPKCQHRNVTYQHINDFFTEALCMEAKTHWQSNLGNFVTELLPCEHILSETKAMLLEILPDLR